MNARVVNLFGAVALAFASVGCATETTAYVPGSEPQPATNQTPAASYPIPAMDPKGTAYVMSFGAEPMKAPSGTLEFYLHLRIAAENRSDAVAWTIVTNDQVVNLGTAPLHATYAEASVGGSVLTLTQGQHGTLDVFYPLPQGGPQRATLSWQVRRGSEPVAGNTSFELVPSNQTADYVDYRPVDVAVEWWPDWWWGMGFYPWFGGPGWWGYWGPHYHGGWGYRGGGGWRGGGFHGGGGWRGGGGSRGGGGGSRGGGGHR
ncbi:MAG: hypothetical protein WCG85_00540 [Polyangia bacterium]